MAQVNSSDTNSWRELHQATLKESDPEKLHDMILAVEEAMFLRAQELGESEADQKERAAIDEAAERLLTIKTERLGWPGIGGKRSHGD